jgi:hypothetical protein
VPSNIDGQDNPAECLNLYRHYYAEMVRRGTEGLLHLHQRGLPSDQAALHAAQPPPLFPGAVNTAGVDATDSVPAATAVADGVLPLVRSQTACSSLAAIDVASLLLDVDMPLNTSTPPVHVPSLSAAFTYPTTCAHNTGRAANWGTHWCRKLRRRAPNAREPSARRHMPQCKSLGLDAKRCG